MSWYYAGPEGKPAGPVSLEELQARRGLGTISSETYVIEHTGQPGDIRTWRRYGEVFPSVPPMGLPPPPPLAPQPQSHPLFPSASPRTASSVFTSPAGPDPYYVAHAARKTNACCLWGLIMGAGGLALLPVCGVGALLALPALVVSILGLIQVQGHREQNGRGLGLTGMVLSALNLLILVVFLAWAIPLAIRQHGQTTTEQTTNDSE